MAKRKSQGSATTPSRRDSRVIALAEQVGRIAGTMHSKADSALDRRALKQQVSRIRKTASELLKQLTRIKRAQPATRSPDPRGRSGGKVDAPGKKHRTAPPRTRLPRAAKTLKRNVAHEMGRSRRG